MAKILDGRFLADQSLEKLKIKITKKITVSKNTNLPGLAVICVGDSEASKIYVNKKKEACQKVGIQSFSYDLPASTTEKELLNLIDELNKNLDVHGILLQLPLPEKIRSDLILDKIDCKKDVDGFHPYNLGLLAQKRPFFRPCTPYGIVELLNFFILKNDSDFLAGKHAVILGASNIVGRPMVFELLALGCTVTICHSKTKKLDEITRNADLLISAVGKPGLVQAGHVKPNAIVIDVGINRISRAISSDSKQQQIVGDVEFESVKEKASWITPVPGGVGPMTVAMLLENTVKSWESFNSLIV